MTRPCNGSDAPLRSVTIEMGDQWTWAFDVGSHGVTAIKWGSMNGHMAALPTVEVWKGDRLHSEHPFHNCLGVEYAAPETDNADA